MAVAEGVTPTATLYDRYLTWCSLNQMRDVLTIKSFSARMKKLGYQSSKSGSVRNFRGIALKPEVWDAWDAWDRFSYLAHMGNEGIGRGSV